MNPEIIYLDYAAATPLDKRVFAAMQPYFGELFYNPSAAYQPAREVKHAVEDARAKTARHLGAKPGEIVFTAGATESINLAFNGVLDDKSHVLVSSIEHQAVLETAKLFHNTVIPVDEKGKLNFESLEISLRPDTKLISVSLVNNELGVTQQLKRIAKIVGQERQKRLEDGNLTPLYLHTDASQATGLFDLHVARLGVDLMTLGSGKFYGPKQTGILFIHTGVKLQPLIMGGGQEQGLRSGTENVPNIIGFSEALAIADQKRKTEFLRLSQLKAEFIRILREAFPAMMVLGDQKQSAAHIVAVAWPKLDAERALFGLEARGVLVATGSACAANKGTRSHVLQAIGLRPEEADGSLRFSFGKYTNKDEIIRAAKIITEVVTKEQAR